jgi:hypothetical protein
MTMAPAIAAVRTLEHRQVMPALGPARNLFLRILPEGFIPHYAHNRLILPFRRCARRFESNQGSIEIEDDDTAEKLRKFTL